MSFFLYTLYSTFPHPLNKGCLIDHLQFCLDPLLVNNPYSNDMLILLYHIFFFLYAAYAGLHLSLLLSFFFSVCHFFCTHCTRPSPTLQMKVALFVHLYFFVNPLLETNCYYHYTLLLLYPLSFFLYAAYAGLHLSLLIPFFLMYVLFSVRAVLSLPPPFK